MITSKSFAYPNFRRYSGLLKLLAASDAAPSILRITTVMIPNPDPDPDPTSGQSTAGGKGHALRIYRNAARSLAILSAAYNLWTSAGRIVRIRYLTPLHPLQTLPSTGTPLKWLSS
jgi:hypothetical protein